MLLHWHYTLTPLRLFACTVALGLPCLAVAETSSTNAEKNEETRVAVLAEDENVEDVERSQPRRKDTDPTASATNSTQPATDTESSDAKTGAKKVAPNIDLKEVASPHEPELKADSAAPAESEVATTPAEDSEIRPGEETSGMVPMEPAIQPAKSFTLLDTEILPGTSTRLAWSPGIQIAGLSQPTPVLVVNGANAGPTLCLTGAIHGDELNGIEIIRRTMYDLDPEKLSGRVVGIPIVNLPGFQQGSRYLPDRRDLNRHFPGSPDGSLADRIAHSLFENIIRRCNMLVDIHTGSLKRTNLPQLRADMNNPDVATFTQGFDRMAVVHSSGSPGMLRSAAVEAGITTVTLEAGESHRIQEHQIEAGVNSLTSLMERQGMISRMFVWGDPEPVYYDSDWIRAQHGGILFSEVDLGARVSEGEILGYVADPITNAQYPIRSSSNGRIIGMAVDQVVMAGFAAYHIGTEAEVPGE
ncbi:succinylglutamate desuccinylase/aspartoacylase family protein [Marinobacter sp. M216]|uniref:Succinylglutamate desuccinylase/aspartoacylase family protein n=1 Tax=Marinobacter albus TaxID=3030833 RepID=A0ABT7H6Y5_9GAMM|nr:MULTISPECIES: succinylglutamate desuccinylase/aspartoacylase family protein [unclassified Marinobacter]MBW7471598.1 succinylglutamate desuccinylase/aspartoacylase family protein [Marinobacter sp. F4218]MDK9556123.1 succinylglutamate desuccinylase/aspartoacylase family protein [Marinobacter sp. M216]